MTAPAVTIKLPDQIYDQLLQRAATSRRTVEAEVVDIVVSALPDDELPDYLQEAIAPLALLDDAALERAARLVLPPERAEQLEELHFKLQREGLTASEAETEAQLIRQYERTMLIRAHAALLLHQRGHDVSKLLDRP